MVYPSYSAVEKLKRHPDYYLPGGDIYFLVEDFLFRVHRYFFDRESAWFREKLSTPAPAGQTAKGSSDSNPFPLDDVVGDDFARFLWVFYNRDYSVYTASADEWLAILKLACDWRFGDVKKLVSRELEKFQLPPVQKIEIYQTYDLDKKLLIPSYTELCLRPEALTLQEGRRLTLETALLLADARERVCKKLSGRNTLSPSSANGEEVDAIIRSVFGLSAARRNFADRGWLWHHWKWSRRCIPTPPKNANAKDLTGADISGKGKENGEGGGTPTWDGGSGFDGGRGNNRNNNKNNAGGGNGGANNNSNNNSNKSKKF
ncbi:hypothetical protein A0H81_10106 [Grifola frondosa]|uniref:BTB domain-containing protein n=1 Tax=Grifola frondosa TaxID=5627 RepID=A0A1C7M353_GRIFR|nr:hypothetical protein A0H81_10106 [Grifola frondosa]